MTIAVTGATGALGRLIIESLLQRGASPTSITAVARDQEKLDALAPLGVYTAVADYGDQHALALAFSGADTVMLVSGSEVGQRVTQHRNVIDAAKAAGATRIVYTSAPHADTSALILAPEHRATEEMIRASGLDFTILRNNWYSENYAGSLAGAESTGNYVSSTGDGRVASASRIDFAEAAAVVLTADGHEGAVYELGGDYAWTAEELVAAMSDILGSEVTHIAVDSDEHAALLTDAGLDAGTVGFLVGLDANIRDGLLSETSGDLARLIDRPTTPLAEGLRAATDR